MVTVGFLDLIASSDSRLLAVTGGMVYCDDVIAWSCCLTCILANRLRVELVGCGKRGDMATAAAHVSCRYQLVPRPAVMKLYAFVKQNNKKTTWYTSVNGTL